MIPKKWFLLPATAIFAALVLSGCVSTAGNSESGGDAEGMNTTAIPEQTADSGTEPTVQNPDAPVSSDDAGQAGGERTTNASGDAGVAATPPNGGRNGDATGGPNVPEGRVLLRFQGDEGTDFSGTCSVNGEEENVAGSVPDRKTFRLAEGALECTLTNDGDGILRVLLDSGDDRSVYEISDSGGEITFSYSGSGSSSSVTSSSSSGSSSQSSSVTSSGSSSSSVVVQQNSSSR